MNQLEHEARPESVDTADAAPLGDYLSERPSLLLRFLDVAEQYAHGDGKDAAAVARRA